MLREHKKTLMITSVVILLPILIGAVCWNSLPDEMATHFGTNNEANGFSGKAFAVFGLPLFLLAIHWFAAIVTSRDPKKQNISPGMFTFVLWIIPVVSWFCAAVMYPYNLGRTIDVGSASMTLIGALLIAVGIFLPKARQNYTIGIRVPWTLANEENWDRTHRFAGKIWIAGGTVIAAMALCGAVKVSLLAVISVVVLIVPFVYSFLLHEKKGL